MALYDSDTSAGHGDWNGKKGGASDSDDASLDGIASLAAGVPAIGGAGIEVASVTSGDELPDERQFGSYQASTFVDCIRGSMMPHYDIS